VESIPQGILAHISNCEYCRGEVERLRIMLAEAEEPADRKGRQTAFVTGANLRLHYSYVGAFVRCETVRPFLPGMAVPAPAMRVPTPITVHLDKCEQCAKDLEAIRSLDLTNVQLYRLGGLFAQEADVHGDRCAETRRAVDSGTLSVFSAGSAATFRHLCACPGCRTLLEKYWERMGEKLSDNVERSWVPCDAVSAAGVFDCVVPYGFDAEHDADASFRRSVMSHVLNCPKCREKMEGVRKAVYGIMEREESGVVTCCKVEESARASVPSGGDDLYEDWPIDVQVLGRARREAVKTGVPAEINRTKKEKQVLRLKWFIRPAAAAAIVLAVGFLVFSGPAARAFDLGQISKALGQINNVRIVRSGADQAGVRTEVWVSRRLNIKMVKTGQKCVLWDIRNKAKKSRDFITGSVTTVALDDVPGKLEGAADAPWGLLPFDDVSNLPKGAEWKAAADEDVETTIPETRVYDLTWAEKGLDGSMVYSRWRAYIDIETKLPKRTELWEDGSEKEYALLMVTEITYPVTGEVEAAMREAGF
jgi:hypothetical protein